MRDSGPESQRPSLSLRIPYPSSLIPASFSGSIIVVACLHPFLHGGQHFRCRQYSRTIGGNAVNAVTRINQVAYRGVLTLLLVMVLIVPLLFSPNLAAWRAVKPITFEILALGLVALALVQSTLPGCKERIREFLRIG